jgi:hypothetical protein
MVIREHTEARLRQERVDLFKRMSRTLRQFGRNGNDYHLFKERTWAYRHLIFTDSSQFLRSQAIKSLQTLLADFPDWEIIICVVNQQSDSEDVRQYGFEWPDSQIVIRDDEIVDSLDRDRLPREFRDVVIEGSRPDTSLGDCSSEARGGTEDRYMFQKIGERPRPGWHELFSRLKSVLQRYGKEAKSGGDYFLIDHGLAPCVHEIEIHQLHMLRLEVIKALHEALVGFPDWEVEISVSIPEAGITIYSNEGLTIREDEIIDALDRTLLPKEYQGLVYERSRPPKRPDDVVIPGLQQSEE